MDQGVKAVLVKDSGWSCPYCESGQEAAVENGFDVEGTPTDLMLCIRCEKLYIVYPTGFLKGKPRRRAEYPKDITISIPDEISVEKEWLLDGGLPRLARKYGPWIHEDLRKGQVRYSQFLTAHPETLQRADDAGRVHHLFVYADDVFSGVQVGVEGTFKVSTEDGYSMSGDDIVLIKKEENHERQ